MYKVSSFTKNAYRVNEVAKMLGVTTKTIRNYDAEGKIKMIRTEGNQRQIMKDDLIQYLDEKGLIEWDVDSFGNSISFSDNIMSSMTTKGLLSKWTNYLYHQMRYCLSKYYMCVCNVDVGDKNYVVVQFKDIDNLIVRLIPVLEDLVDIRIKGMEDIFIAVYGIESDEVYVCRRFLYLFQMMDKWDEDFMWNDCKTDERLRGIIG